MRPPAETHSALRHPLDDLLGRTAFVRILRVLSQEEKPLVRAEISRRTGLTKPGVGKAVDELADLGLLDLSKSGRQVLVSLRRDHPLAEPLSELFLAEEGRFDDVLQGLRDAVEEEGANVHAAWVEGPVARWEDTPHDPLVLGVLATIAAVDEVHERIQQKADRLGGRAEARIQVRSYTEADVDGELNRETVAEARPLYGPPPAAYFPDVQRPVGAASHEALDRAGLALGRAIAERLKQDPSLVERARDWVEKQLARGVGGAEGDLREWHTILESQSVARLRDLLTESSDRAIRLRQSNPFVTVLSEQERRELREQALAAGDE